MGRTRNYKRCSPEFKRAALKRASEDGLTDKQGGDELGISTRQLGRWRDEFRLLGNDAFPGQGHSRDEEVTRLKRELAKVKQERDFLKEAAAYFARGSGSSRIRHSGLDPASIHKEAYELGSQCLAVNSGPGRCGGNRRGGNNSQEEQLSSRVFAQSGGSCA